jgi:hypothetical protein
MPGSAPAGQAKAGGYTRAITVAAYAGSSVLCAVAGI